MSQAKAKSKAKTKAKGETKTKTTTELKPKVWKKYTEQPATDQAKGRCFCCNDPLLYKNAQMGHVLSDAHKGKVTVANLRPVCGSCNTTMSKTHMFEYMLREKTAGCRNLDMKSPKIQKISEFVETVRETTQQLDALYAAGHVKTKTIVEGRKAELNSNNYTINARKKALKGILAFIKEHTP